MLKHLLVTVFTWGFLLCPQRIQQIFQNSAVTLILHLHTTNVTIQLPDILMNEYSKLLEPP